MKKLFTMLVASLCGTMVYAQTGAVSVNDVTIVKGSTTQMEVTINNAKNNTAFQFDLALPAGVSVKEAKLNGEYGETRKLLNGPVLNKKNEPRQRFLSYDDNNALLADGAKVIVTLAATEEAETAALTGEGFVVVTPAGTSVGDGETASANVKVFDGVPITIGAKGVTTLVSDLDIDFSDAAVKAYIATGYDMNTGDIWLTRVKDVPANTPILVMGEPSGDNPYVIPTTISRIYYPENFLKGNANGPELVDQTGAFINMRLNNGQFEGLASTVTQIPAGRCYLQIPATIPSATGDDLTFKMGANGTKSYTGKYDLDFTNANPNDLKAYTVTGYDKDGTVWLTRVYKVSTQTPLLLMGTANTDYSVPSTAQQSCYVNMLCGDANNSTTINKTSGEFTNLVLKSGEYVGLTNESSTLPAGLSYLPIPTSFIPATARGEVAMGLKMEEAEVITMKAILGGEDDGTTGISRVAAEAAGNDAWYNLSGQRISVPTKKGLYIKNGRKIVVK